MIEKYDSSADTQAHIDKVRWYLRNLVVSNFLERAEEHDASSLKDPEKRLFDTYRPLLNSLEYNSSEYMAALMNLRDGLAHHYERNSHHPEHYENGVDGMSLFDVMEMLIDWKAAIDRKGTEESVLGNFNATCERFSISPQLANIIRNTVNEIGWD